MIVYSCPKCGHEVVWQVHGDKEKAYCACNPQGPVMERDFPPPVMLPDVGVVGMELIDLPGINRETMGALVDRGYTTLEKIQAASDEELLAISGIGPIRLAKIRGIIRNDK